MDHYVIVAELDFPAGAFGAWRTKPGKKEQRSLAETLEGAEGDVSEVALGDHYSLRTLLIDAAYFELESDLAAAFDRAAALGARGTWYSGDLVSGTLGRLGSKPSKAKVSALGAEVARWVHDAASLGSDFASSARAKKKKPSAKKKTLAPKKKKTAAQPAKKKPAKAKKKATARR